MSAGASQGTLDVDDRIAQTGCEAQYRRLEDCLDRHDRVWKQCQSDLHEFGRCMKSNIPGADVKPGQPPV
ncbi:cytochrome c oxidase assembly factor 4 mitochondrial protein, putative [Babesia ovata]|uniref:Cytochrome c oxidase assembly factor 4 mitochondrial protein, putative n=1 Tax=Babesia ovata TaxID=189622 RepID=A0A2H6K894_9APIC|nr:cytochrome c oxidase assembly factor 4 mitochondrial protein, putative [Babesia ovata]GBE59217.1 cytochrome c oxidase assembly factor 4 mitochondrial protein, putative [Babesia ovata]